MFAALAKLVERYPRWILLGWLIATLAAAPFALRVGEVLTGQPQAPAGGVSQRVRDLVAREFESHESELLIAIARPARGANFPGRVGSDGFTAAVDAAIQAIEALEGVDFVRDHRSAAGLDLVSEEAGFSALVIGLATSDLAEAKAVVASVRAALNRNARLQVDLSGGAATVMELESVSERDARRAELFGLPISLLILLIAFGAVVASALPLLSAVTSIVVSSAALFWLGHVLEFAVFTQTIVTMLGLATGIDYALLIVNRFREELRKTFDPRQAAARTAATAGKAVAFSGLTVLVALAALLVPPVAFIRSIGVGTMLVLLVAVLVAITAVPATLALLGHRVNWLRVTRREPGLRSRAYWRERALAIMRRPRLWTAVGLVGLFALALPAVRMEVADPGARGLAPATESRRTLEALSVLGLEGLMNPFDVLVDLGATGFYHPASVRQVSLLERAVLELEGVGEVTSPLSLSGVPRLLLYQYYASRELALASEVAPLARATVSESGRYVLVRVYPAGAVTPTAAGAMSRGIRDALAELGIGAELGGVYVAGTEWTEALYSHFPLALALVALATFVLLGVAFRSLLIPFKALVLNVLTVGAAFGVITLVFQFGALSWLVGGGGVLGYVDTSAPLFIFAIVFGLSMDYEVFMVARIREAHESGLSDKDAVATAMSATGGVITSAAAVMITVFSLLLFSHVELIRTLGLGLAVAVLLDATLVRLTLVPAVMTMAGRWNWWLPAWLERRLPRFDPER